MAEYVGKEQVIEWFRPYGHEDEGIPYYGLVTDIREMKPADVSPVVHGRWEWFDEDVRTPVTGYEREWGWRCSHCGEELPDNYDDPDDSPTFWFCYNCGAKMDGGAE